MKSLTILCCLFSIAIALKDQQIRLEDIEKDNLDSEKMVKQETRGFQKPVEHKGPITPPKMQHGFVPMKIHYQRQQSYAPGRHTQYVPQQNLAEYIRKFYQGQLDHQKHEQALFARGGVHGKLGQFGQGLTQEQLAQGHLVQGHLAQGQLGQGHLAQGQLGHLGLGGAQQAQQFYYPQQGQQQFIMYYPQQTQAGGHQYQQYENVPYVTDNNVGVGKQQQYQQQYQQVPQVPQTPQHPAPQTQQPGQSQQYAVPQYYYVQQSASNSIQTVLDPKTGQVQYIMYIPTPYYGSANDLAQAQSIAGSQAYASNQAYSSNQAGGQGFPDAKAVSGPQGNSLGEGQTFAGAAYLPEVGQGTPNVQYEYVSQPPKSQKYTEVQYVPSNAGKEAPVQYEQPEAQYAQPGDQYVQTGAQYLQPGYEQTGLQYEQPAQYAQPGGQHLSGQYEGAQYGGPKNTGVQYSGAQNDQTGLVYAQSAAQYSQPGVQNGHHQTGAQSFQYVQPEFPKHTQVQYVQQHVPKHQYVTEHVISKSHKSLLDSYVPSVLQIQYYKQAQLNAIQHSSKLSHGIAGKTDFVKQSPNSYLPINHGSLSYNYAKRGTSVGGKPKK